MVVAALVAVVIVVVSILVLVVAAVPRFLALPTYLRNLAPPIITHSLEDALLVDFVLYITYPGKSTSFP